MQDEYRPGVPGASTRGGGEAVSGAREASQADGDERCGLTEQTQKRIGTHLRAMYEGLVQQPVPDRFKELIEKLHAADGPKAG